MSALYAFEFVFCDRTCASACTGDGTCLRVHIPRYHGNLELNIATLSFIVVNKCMSFVLICRREGFD